MRLEVTENNEKFYTELDNPSFGAVLGDAQRASCGVGLEPAYKLYAKAAQLGSSTACQKLGQMHVSGEGCVEDRQKALDFLKRGVQLGNTSCYYDLFDLFMDGGFNTDEDFATALKCMDKYLESDHFKNEIETPFGGLDWALEGYCQIMLSDVTINRGRTIPPNHLAALSKYKHKILKSKREMADNSPDIADILLEQIKAIRQYVPDPTV